MIVTGDHSTIEPDSALANGGGNGHPPDMEARIAKLEAGMDDVRSTLGRLEPLLMRASVDLAEVKGRSEGTATHQDLGKVREEMAELKGRVSSIPGYWGTGLMNAATVIVVLVGLVAVMKFLSGK